MGFIDNFKLFSGNDSKFDEQKLIKGIIKPNFFIKKNSSIDDSIRILRNRGVTGMPVVDERNNVIGFISEKDCLKYLYGAFYFNEISGDVSKYMNKNVQCIEEGTDLPTILKLFTENPYHVYPVINKEKKYIGILSRTDLLTEIYAIMDFIFKESSAA